EEPDLVQVDDEPVAALADQVDEQLPQPRRGVDIDLAPHVDDLDAVPGVVTQLQVHASSSAMPGVISTSVPAPRAGVARARADPLPHSATFHYHAYTECSGCLKAGIPRVGKTGVTSYTRSWSACSAALSGTASGTWLARAAGHGQSAAA